MKKVQVLAKTTGFIVMTAPTGKAEGWMVEFFKKPTWKFSILRSWFVTIVSTPFCDIHIYRRSK